ncbi:MAG: 5-formyltetrahydrofolate cyclo-ligase [Alphaproteobacteria bacterium]
MTATPSPPSPQLHEQKTNMRRTMRALRDNIPLAVREEAAQRVAAEGLGFLAHPPHTETNTNARVVAAYFPVRGEFDCLPLLARLATDGWRTALPAVPTEDGPLIFRAWTPGAPLSQGKFRISEPAEGAPIVQPTVVLTPLLAFDAAGQRLGYGRGYYDQTLASLRRINTVTAIGLAFDEQEVAQVPAEHHDERLDWILLPSGARPCKNT